MENLPVITYLKYLKENEKKLKNLTAMLDSIHWCLQSSQSTICIHSPWHIWAVVSRVEIKLKILASW